MKKIIAVLLALALTASLAGCSSGNTATPTDTSPAAESREADTSAVSEADSTEALEGSKGLVPDYLEFFSGSQGGSWYQVGSQLAAITQQATGVTSKVAAGGGSANPDTLQNGEGYFGLVYSGVGYQAYKGEGEYTESHDSLRAVISMYSMPFLIVALQNDDSVNSVYDLADKDLSLGKAGQTGYTIAQEVLKAHGIDIDGDTFTGINSLLGDSERMDMLRDRQLDAITGLLPLDNSTLQSMSMTPGIKLISMDEKVIEEIQKNVPGLEKITIAPKSFDESQDEEIVTVAAITSLYCREDLDEDLVYNTTKAIYENAQSLYQFFGEENSVILDNPLTGIDEGMPVHPGAERFYREIGLIK